MGVLLLVSLTRDPDALYTWTLQLVNSGFMWFPLILVEKATCFKWLQKGDLLRSPAYHSQKGHPGTTTICSPGPLLAGGLMQSSLKPSNLWPQWNAPTAHGRFADDVLVFE